MKNVAMQIHPQVLEPCLLASVCNSAKRLLQVLKGGNLDIDVEIRSPKGKILYRDFRRKHDTLPLEVSVGIFTFCFSNAFSSLTHKVVHFNLRPSEMDTRALAREVDSAPVRPGVNTMVDQMMETIHAFTTKVNTLQAYDRQQKQEAKLSRRREPARCFVSLNTLLSHSTSLKVIRNDTLEYGCANSY